MATREAPVGLDHPTVVPADADSPGEDDEESRWDELTQ